MQLKMNNNFDIYPKTYLSYFNISYHIFFVFKKLRCFKYSIYLLKLSNIFCEFICCDFSKKG